MPDCITKENNNSCVQGNPIYRHSEILRALFTDMSQFMCARQSYLSTLTNASLTHLSLSPHHMLHQGTNSSSAVHRGSTPQMGGIQMSFRNCSDHAFLTEDPVRSKANTCAQTASKSMVKHMYLWYWRICALRIMSRMHHELCIAHQTSSHSIFQIRELRIAEEH